VQAVTCALPPVDQGASQLGWHDGYFLAPSGTRDAPPIYHNGLDFMADAGSPVIAALGGTVAFKGYQRYGDVLPGSASRDGMGHYVVIDHGRLPGGFWPIVTVYANLQGESPLEVGRTVEQGALVGRVGSSGRHSDRPYLFFKVMRRGEAGADYRRGMVLSPFRDFFEPLGVVRTGEQTPGPTISPYSQRPAWGGNLVQQDRCAAPGLSSLSPSRIQSKYTRFGITQLSSRAVYAPALYEEGSPSSMGGLVLGLAAVAGAAWWMTRKPAPKAPPWWVRQQRWRGR
jgi:murein DD-endopeptidase MepM/ murein hydrolase activator NlpD